MIDALALTLHIGPSHSGQFSIWLLGAVAGIVLAVGVNKLIRARE